MTVPEFTFVMHHVGARGGSCGFVMPAPFHADTLDILYEPDADGLRDITELRSTSSPPSVALPYALGARTERRLFHLHLIGTVAPFGSSTRVTRRSTSMSAATTT